MGTSGKGSHWLAKMSNMWQSKSAMGTLRMPMFVERSDMPDVMTILLPQTAEACPNFGFGKSFFLTTYPLYKLIYTWRAETERLSKQQPPRM